MSSLMLSCLVIVIVTTLRGMKRGFSGIIYGVVTWGLIILLLPDMVPRINKVIQKDGALNAAIEKTVSPYVGVLAMGALSITNDEDGNISGIGFDNDQGILQNYIQSFIGSEEQLEKYEKQVLGELEIEDSKSANRAYSDILDKYMEPEEKDEMTKFIARYVILALAVAISYIMLKILAIILGALAGAALPKRDNNSWDRFGLLWGVIEGGLYICVLMSVISVARISSIGQTMIGMINESVILKMFYDRNLFGSMVRDIFSLANL